MKVQVTIEVSDDARIGVAVVEADKFRPATRIEVRDWATAILDDQLEDLEGRVKGYRAEILKELKI
jgi:hypothetical protein